MLNIFKRKQKQTEYSSLKQKYYDEAKEIAKINDLSPTQIDELISNNADVDYLKEEIKSFFTKPDIQFLKEKFCLKNIKENRNDVSVEDVVFGTSAGDIIGSKYEFSEHETVESIFSENLFSTDDTALSFATLEAIKENPENPDFQKAYLAAYNKNKDAGYGSSFISWTTNNEHKPYGSCANGCLMRISAIPAFYQDYNKMIDIAIKSTMTTHNSIEAVKATIIFATCIWMAINQYSKTEIFEYCKQYYDYSDNVLQNKIMLYKPYKFSDKIIYQKEISKDSLFAGYALPMAIDHFYHTSCFEDCAVEILNSFCDSDTICAMVGGLWCAFCGNLGFDIRKFVEKYS